MTKDEALKMEANRCADYWANHYDRKSKGDMQLLRKHVFEQFQKVAKEALEQPETCKLSLENILHGSLLDKHNRNDDGMLDAKRWSDAERHLDTWIKTAKVALDE